jgi:hypothetical protein
MSVLATVLPSARQSQWSIPSAECAGRLPLPAKTNLAHSGERLHASAVPMLWACLNESRCSGKISNEQMSNAFVMFGQ